MINASDNNKRVAKNTLFLYFRMILIMLVTLYTSRVVLAELGISDYGIYNVVGGVVMMFAFLNNSMATATQRYLTYELGKGDTEKIKKVFATALNIHIIIALIIVLLAETVGLWFLNYKMNIPVDRIVAANWVFQFSILTFCTNIIQVPYNAALISHEKMSIYAYISILEALLKLGIVYLLTISPFDKLAFYGVLVFLVQLMIRNLYQYYCRKHYKECRFALVWDKKLYKEMSGFAGWNMFGSIAWLLRDQGLNILLNLFFGPVINAARGISMQVCNAIMGFITNFQVALNPQITKNYANNNILQMENLVISGLKFSFILLFCIMLPLSLNVDFVLNLWLEKVPDYAGFFIILILIDSLIGNLFGTPLMTSLAATGKIRNYQIVVSSIIILIVPVSYIVLKLESRPEAVFYVSILLTGISGVVRFMFCHKQIGFSYKKLISNVLLPVMGITLLSLPIPLYFRIYIWKDTNTFSTFILLCVLCIAIALIASWLVGLRKNEKQLLIAMIKNKLHK